MEPMIKEYIASFIRTLILPLISVLSEAGYITNDEAIAFAISVASIAVAVLWSLVNKFLWKKTTESALQHPASKSENVLREIIATSGTGKGS